MANILNSPGRYVQGAGELSKLGKYAEGYGKKALVLISRSGYKRIGGSVEAGFAKTGCSTVFDYFNGECCKRKAAIWSSVSAAAKSWIRLKRRHTTGIRRW